VWCTRGNAGDDGGWIASPRRRDITSIAAYRRKGMARAHGVDPRQSNRLSYTARYVTQCVAVNSLLTRLFFTSGAFFLRSAFGASRRASCSLWTSCWLRMSRRLCVSCWLCMGRRLCMSCGLCCLLLGRASRGCFILGRLVLVRACCRCLSLGGPTLCGLGFGCLVLGCLVLSGLALSRLILSCFILGCLVLSGLSLSGLALSRLILSCFVLGCVIPGCLILGGLARSCLVFGCFVRCARLFGRYHSGAAELPRLRSCSDSRPALVHGRQECMVGAGSVHMLGLQRCWWRVLLVGRRLFCRSRASRNSAFAAVIADMVHCGFVDYGLFVNIGDVRDVHVTHRAVVEEGSVIPVSASIADTTIAEAVVYAAVEADTLAPIAFIPGESVAAPTPITGGPQEANGGRLDPRPRHPEVAFIAAIRPVARRPQITGGGAHGLFVHR